MSKLPSMPLFVDAYLADTTHLSLEEHGAYLLLLMAMWRRGGAIENYDRDIARVLGLMPRAWLRLKPRLMPMLSVYGSSPEMLTQARLQKEWNYSVENSRRQSEKGRRGAEERWQRKHILSQIQGNAPAIGQGNGRPIAPIPNKNNTDRSISGPSLKKLDEALALAERLNTPLMKAKA